MDIWVAIDPDLNATNANMDWLPGIGELGCQTFSPGRPGVRERRAFNPLVFGEVAVVDGAATSMAGYRVKAQAKGVVRAGDAVGKAANPSAVLDIWPDEIVRTGGYAVRRLSS